MCQYVPSTRVSGQLPCVLGDMSVEFMADCSSADCPLELLPSGSADDNGGDISSNTTSHHDTKGYVCRSGHPVKPHLTVLEVQV